MIRRQVTSFALIAVLLRLHVFKGIFESLVCSVKREDSLEVTQLGSGVVEGMNPSFVSKKQHMVLPELLDWAEIKSENFHS